MSVATIVIESDREVEHLVAALRRRNDNKRIGISLIANFLAGMASGSKSGKVMLQIEDSDGDAADLDIVCDQSEVSAGDTITLAGITLTAATSPSVNPADGEFSPGASDTELGENLAAAINAHPRLKGMLSATDATGTATVAFSVAGTVGNSIGVSTDNATAFTFSGDNLADGAPGTIEAPARVYLCGVA